MSFLNASISIALILELVVGGLPAAERLALEVPPKPEHVERVQRLDERRTLMLAASEESAGSEESEKSAGSEESGGEDAASSKDEGAGSEREPEADVPAPAPEPEASPHGAEAESGDTEAEEEGSAGNVAEDARELVERLQSFYEDTRDFTASFTQTYTYQVGREVVSRGSVSFKRPAMMRWDYEHPRERKFVVDGSDLWIWTPEDFTAVRQRDFTADSLSTSITFLWGEGRLEDEFHIELQGEDTLELTPITPEGGFRKVIFKVDTESGRVLESTVMDPQGNLNHMAFSDMRQNTGVDDERFSFTPPSGADVQEM